MDGDLAVVPSSHFVLEGGVRQAEGDALMAFPAFCIAQYAFDPFGAGIDGIGEYGGGIGACIVEGGRQGHAGGTIVITAESIGEYDAVVDIDLVGIHREVETLCDLRRSAQ